MNDDAFPLADFADLLMPLLTPYEAVFYVYLYRTSALGDHGRLARASMRGVAAIVTSSRPNKNGVSYGQAKDVFYNLESKGVIQKAGDVTNEGTLYRLLEPRDVPACQERLAVLERVAAPAIVPSRELDFYNVAENRVKVYERDGYRCRYCGKQLTLQTVTLDHVVAISKGGGHEFENLVAACLDCNSKKNGRLVGDFLVTAQGSDLTATST
jgi:hypothetical protein